MLFGVITAPVIAVFIISLTAFLLRAPKVAEYTLLDKIGIATNIILSILYVPMSLIGVMSVFAADAPQGAATSAALSTLIPIGVSLPFVSFFFMILSIRFRRKGHAILSFCLQFIPLLLFAIMEIGFATVGG